MKAIIDIILVLALYALVFIIDYTLQVNGLIPTNLAFGVLYLAGIIMTVIAVVIVEEYQR